MAAPLRVLRGCAVEVVGVAAPLRVLGGCAVENV